MDKLELSTYMVSPKGLCITLIRDNETYGKLSVNIPDGCLLDNNEFWAKIYGENEDWAYEVLRNGLFEPSNKTHQLPYCPVYSFRLKPEGIKQLFELTYNSKTDIYEASSTLFNLHDKYCS